VYYGPFTSNRTSLDFNHTVIPSDTAIRFYHISCDVNGDGFDDLVIGEASIKTTTLTVFWGSSSGLNDTNVNTTDITPFLSTTYLPSHAVQLYCGDFNNDKFGDIFMQGVTLLLFSGSIDGLLPDGKVIVLKDYNVSRASSYKFAQPADFDGDGYSDLLFNDDSNVYVAFGNNFPDNTVWKRGAQQSTVVTLGDLGGDGASDFAVCKAECQLFFGSSFPLLGQTVGTEVIGIGDANYDGLDDIVEGSYFADFCLKNTRTLGSLNLDYGEKSGVTNPQKKWKNLGITQVYAIGDVDDDARADIAVIIESSYLYVFTDLHYADIPTESSSCN